MLTKLKNLFRQTLLEKIRTLKDKKIIYLNQDQFTQLNKELKGDSTTIYIVENNQMIRIECDPKAEEI